MLRHVLKFTAIAAAILMTAPAVSVAPAHAAVGLEVEIGPDWAPPRLRAEHRPPRPRRGAVWQAGRWNWVNGRYDWVDGVWIDPPRARAAWVPGHWAHRGRRWLWVEGHWV